MCNETYQQHQRKRTCNDNNNNNNNNRTHWGYGRTSSGIPMATFQRITMTTSSNDASIRMMVVTQKTLRKSHFPITVWKRMTPM